MLKTNQFIFCVYLNIDKYYIACNKQITATKLLVGIKMRSSRNISDANKIIHFILNGSVSW